MRDVTTGVCEKMIRRHPHIFGQVKVETSQDVLQNWGVIKEKEKQLKTYTQSLQDVPQTLPALMRSLKVQQRAAKAGFDWESIEGPLDKISEEADELREAINTYGNGSPQVEEELGDLLFSVVNVARGLDLQPELTLLQSVKKFIRRFEGVEKAVKAQGKDMKEMTLSQLDALWNKQKMS
jgi:tetrapyrrole methylase family protein/MazG family protein